MERRTMTRHMTEWLAARRRQGLPWIRVDKEYRFETDEGHSVPRRSLQRTLAARTAATVAALTPTLGLAAASWVVAVRQMNERNHRQYTNNI